MSIREFTDAKGVKWRVWQTYPARGAAHPAPLRDGWLTFECADCKKRLVPIPDDWENAPPSQLETFLKAAEVPEISLGQAGLLGWTSWLKSVPFTRDADDVVLNPMAA